MSGQIFSFENEQNNLSKNRIESNGFRKKRKKTIRRNSTPNRKQSSRKPYNIRQKRKQKI